MFYAPVKQKINQGFGLKNTAPNMLAFYNSLGFIAHPGQDYACINGTPFYWGGNKGLIEAIYWDRLGGNSLHIITEEDGHIYRHIYYHLKDVVVKVGQTYDTGELLGKTDNSGEGSTGPHLHYEIKEVIKDQYGNYQTINKDNGMKGALDLELLVDKMFVLDHLALLNTQISILQKLIELWKKFLGK